MGEPRMLPLEPKIRRRFAPFAAVGFVALLAAAIPPAPSNWTFTWLAAVLTAVITLVGVLTPWSRLPRWTFVVPPLAYFGVVALLRHAHGGNDSGYAALALLPVIWIAMNLGRRQLSIALAAVLALFLTPPLLNADYGAGEWRRGVVWLGVSALVGLAVEALMREKRDEARQARTQADALAENERVMATIAEVTRGLTSAGDARPLVCQAALDVSGATFAAIVEPDGLGNLVVTAHAGTEFTPGSLGSMPSHPVAPWPSPQDDDSLCRSPLRALHFRRT